MNNLIFLKFYNLSHNSVIFDHFIYFIAYVLPFLVVIGAFIFLIFHHEILKSENILKALLKKWKEILISFFSSVSAWCVATLIKIIMKAPRPYLVSPDLKPILTKTDFSFPSGHATFFMALGVAIYLSHKKAGIVFIILAVLIGLSRIIAGVHFPIDIFAGFCLGFLIAVFIDYLYKRKI